MPLVVRRVYASRDDPGASTDALLGEGARAIAFMPREVRRAESHPKRSETAGLFEAQTGKADAPSRRDDRRKGTKAQPGSKRKRRITVKPANLKIQRLGQKGGTETPVRKRRR